MKLLIYLLLAIQTYLFVNLIIKLKKKNQFFSLVSILGIGCFFYITFPTVFFLNRDFAIFNGIKIIIFLQPLLISSLAGLSFMALLHLMPVINFSDKNEDSRWVEILFFLLSIINLYYLLKFIFNFDYNLAFSMFQNNKSSEIRGLSYLTLERINVTFGYVLGALEVALLGFLWLQKRVSRKLLIFAASPVFIVSLISLSRIGIASFIVMILFCLEQEKKLKKFYRYAFASLIALFLFRPLFYNLTGDQYYTSWFQLSLSNAQNFQELFGEFFTTFSSYLMVYNIEQARFSLHEIYTILFSQFFVPPGFTSLFYSFLGETYPIFRLTDLIVQSYGIHPAHSSLIDFYTFGYWSFLGIFLLILLIYMVSKKPTGINKLIYLYFLSVFFLPFRGSLTLSVIRIFWLIAGLLIFQYLVRKINFVARRGSQ